MSRLYESTLNIPNLIRENETVGVGISSWVHRFDAVAKCYTADDNKERDREVAVFERLSSDSTLGQRAILRYYGLLDGCVIYNSHATAQSASTFDLISLRFASDSGGQSRLQTRYAFFIRSPVPSASTLL